MWVLESMIYVFIVLQIVTLMVFPAYAASSRIDIGNGFIDHGVASPFSQHRGVVATVDDKGVNVVLIWLMDYRGCYALLMINAENGESEEFPIPFEPNGYSPYSTILSSSNKLYTLFNSYFLEFDPERRAFTYFQKTFPRMAMSMTEDDGGKIWAVTYPDSGVVSFNPKTHKLYDYSSVHEENWKQYPRYVALDNTGWVYFGIGNAKSNIIAFDPDTQKARTILPDSLRVRGYSYVYRATNGKVYGLPYGLPGGRGSDNWYELYEGKAKKVGRIKDVKKLPVISGSQRFVYRKFPDGKILKDFDLINRYLVVQDSITKRDMRVSFKYYSEGAKVMGLTVAPGGRICGGTTFPMRLFCYDPKMSSWTNIPSYGQPNTLIYHADRVYIGGYPGGFLLEWNPSKEWVKTIEEEVGSNPEWLTQGIPTINRPHDLIACLNGKNLIMSGTPPYGMTEGGLLIWDRAAGVKTIMKHSDIVTNQSTMSLVALHNGTLLGGTTTKPGTGGVKKAKVAELYILDMSTKRIVWHDAILPKVQSYTDMVLAGSGLVYGIADRRVFFVFDPVEKMVLYKEDTIDEFGLTNIQQGPRVFVKAPEGSIHVLCLKGIARINPSTFKISGLVKSPVSIGAGGDYLNGHIYFSSGSHVYSYITGEQ